MWINLDDRQMTLIESALAFRISEVKRTIDTLLSGNQPQELIERLEAKQKEMQATLDKFGERRSDFDPADPYRSYLMTQADDEMEVDEDAIVSPGSDPGAFVHAWIWVTNSDAGVPDEDDEDTCRTCGAIYEDGGDGFDGECPDCADKTDQKLHPENYED